MHLEIASSLIVGCAVQAAAEAPAAKAADAVLPDGASTPKTDLTTNDNVAGKKGHRLLQKFKERKQQRKDAAKADADLGILSKLDNNNRSLQNDYDYYCPRDTCPTELCDCADSGGSLEDCTSQLQSVCRAGRLGDCVFKDYVQVYEEVYCPFVSCVDEGFRDNQCDCAFYELYCNRLHGTECEDVLGVSSDSPDKKPFFGCDETELKSVCDEASSCKARGDLQGLPDLGSWKGSVMTGIRTSSGEKSYGGAIMKGVTMLSMLWLMVNM